MLKQQNIISHFIGLFLFLVLISSISLVQVDAQDADANIFINFLDTTTMPDRWRTQNLEDWEDGNGNTECKVSSGQYECAFWLYGTLDSTRPLRKLSRPLRKLVLRSNSSLRGSFLWSSLKSEFEGELEHLHIEDVRLPAAPYLNPSADLPRSLIHLDMQKVYNRGIDKDLSDLPPNLQTFRVNHNSWTGQLLLNLLPASLKTLDFENNDLSGIVDPALFPPNLEHFDSRNNKKLSSSTFNVQNLPSSMQVFRMNDHPNVRGSLDFSEFETRSIDLWYFQLSNTGVGGLNLDGLSTMTKLRSFHIQDNKFGAMPFETNKLPCNSIKDLRIHENEFTGAFDLRNPCMDSLEDIYFYKNKFSEFHLPVPRRDSMNLTIVEGYTNELCCFLNAALLPHNGKLHKFHFNANHFSNLINADFFPDSIKELYINGQDGNGVKDAGMDGEINIETLPRSLVRIQMNNNKKLVGSIGDLSKAPRNLRELRMWDNQFAGEIKWNDSPPNLDYFAYSQNRFTSMTDFPPMDSRQLKEIWIGLNDIVGTIIFDNLPPKLRILSVRNNKLHGDLAFLYLPDTVDRFEIQNNQFSSSTYLIDLNHLPTGLDTFNMQNNALTAETRIEVENLPRKWSWSFRHYREFCNLVLHGNHIRELLLCNVTMTITKSLWSLSKTHTSKTLSENTESLSPTEELTHSEELTLSDSMSRMDPLADWMLQVVLLGIPNKPDEWDRMPLREWMCDRRLPSGDVGKTVVVEKYKCCPRSPDPPYLHSCHFEGFEEGKAMIRFPPTYPLESFSFINSSQVSGEFRLHELPNSLKSIRVENTKITAQQLWWHLSPRGLVNASLCDNAFELPDVSFVGTPTSMKTLRLCGGRITGPRNFRGLPDNMLTLDLSRQQFRGTVPWHLLPPGVRHVNLAGNIFTGPIAFDRLPPSIVSLNVSQNLFTGTPVFNGTMSPNLEILDVSHNTGLGGRPNFSNLGRGLRELWATRNGFGGELLSVANVPPNITRIVLRDNQYIGNFEVLDHSLPPHVLANIRSFCADILPGNHFWESKTCDWTHSHSDSVSFSDAELSQSSSLEHSPTSSSTHTHPQDTNTHELTLTTTIDLTQSEFNMSLTSTQSANTPSNDAITATETISDNSQSHSQVLTATPSHELPVTYWNRETVSKSFLYAGAVTSAFVTPSIPAAAALVSRQTAISRAYGGKNGTCGCPTREDPLPEFEDPLQLDLAPAECHGQLVGIFVGNLALSLAIPSVLWVIFAIVFMSRYQQLPSFWDATDSGWPIELLSVFAYALWMPPAVSAMLCAAVRCSFGLGGAAAAASFTLMPFGLYYLMFRRQRHERFCRKKYRVSRKKESCFRTKRFLQYLFAPEGQWIWKPHLVREAIEKEKEKDDIVANDGNDENLQLDEDEKQQRQEEEKEKEIGGEEEEDEIALLEKQMEKIEEEKNEKNETKNEKKPKKPERILLNNVKIKDEDENDDDDIILPPEKDQQEQRFDSIYRLEEKYVKTSWWFLCFEYGVRAFMTIGPPTAEAVPSAYSCTTLRAIYLLAVNCLMIAVWSRRPTNHRALFVAIIVATAVEIVVLCLLLIDDDYGELFGPWLLGAVQIFAVILLIGIEVYTFLLCRWCPWARGKIVLPTAEQSKKEDEEQKNNATKKKNDLEELMLDETSNQQGQVSSSAFPHPDEMNEEDLDTLLGKRSASLIPPSAATKNNNKKSIFSDSIFTTISSSTPLRYPTTKPKRLKMSNFVLARNDSSSSDDIIEQEEEDLLFNNNNNNKRRNSDSSSSEDDNDDHEMVSRTTRLQSLVNDDNTAKRNNDNTTDDMFDKLDKRMRRAYVELVHEDDEVVGKSENLQTARSEFDRYINL